MEEQEKKIGIVVVNYKTPIHLQMCLLSIELYVNNYELVVINNSDEKGSMLVIKGGEPIKKDFYEGNAGFCKGVNAGIKELETEYISIVPADCMITPGWKEKMIKAFLEVNKPGILAPMATQSSGLQEVEAQGLFRKIIEMPRIILNGAVMKRETFWEVGGMDEGFPNLGGSFSDDDLSRRFIMAGHRNYIVDHLIFHIKGQSYHGDVEMFKKDMTLGREYFEKKWKKG
jgi:GT2 family glycosyltransferase